MRLREGITRPGQGFPGPEASGGEVEVDHGVDEQGPAIIARV